MFAVSSTTLAIFNSVTITRYIKNLNLGKDVGITIKVRKQVVWKQVISLNQLEITMYT